MTVKGPFRTLLYLDQNHAGLSQQSSQFKQSSQVVVCLSSPPQSQRLSHPYHESTSDTNPHNIKKYPKSPSLIKPAHNLILDVPFQLPIEVVAQPSFNPRYKNRKKGKSMDFEISAFPLFDIAENKSKSKEQEKSKLYSKYLHQIRDRNTVSELKNYKHSPGRRQKDSYSHKQKSKKSKLVKVTNKLIKNTKKQLEKCLYPVFESQKSKKHFRSTTLNHKPSKYLTGITSNNLLSQQYKSLQLVNRRCKSSLKDCKTKKNTQQMKQIKTNLPFSSKVNSLYSNTTSLFCSKGELQPMTQQTVRITTQQPEQVHQIRKFQSLALDRQNPKHIDPVFNNLQESQDRGSADTHLIIAKYLQFFRNQEAQVSPNYPTEHSLFMQLYEHQSNKTDPMIELEFQAKQLVKEISNVENIQGEPEMQQKQIDDIIRLISNTDALGQQRKEIILEKIRKIIPIANIGSKQLQIPSQKPSQKNSKSYQSQKNQQKPSDNIRSSQPTSSLLESFPSTQNHQLYDLKTLDNILLAHERQLSLKLDEQIRDIEESNIMNTFEKQAEKIKIKKWTNMLIQQSVNTRIKLWKDFNAAKQILGGEINKLKNSGLSKSISEQIILKVPKIQSTPKLKEKFKRQISEEILLEKWEQQQQEENHLSNLQKIEEKMNKKKYQDNITPKCKIEPNSGSSNKFYQSRQQSNSDARIHDLVLIESAEKIEYDYEDSSPIQSKSPQNSRILCEQSSDSQSEHDFTQQLTLVSPSLNYTHPFTTMTEDEKQDIFQFLFIDLCIQLSEQLKPGSTVIINLQKIVNQQKIRSTKRKGILVTYQTVKEYLMKFLQFIKSSSSMSQPIYKELDRPIGPTALELLSYLRPEPAPIEDSQIQTPNVLNTSLYEHYDSFYLDSLNIQSYYEDEQLQCKRRLFLRNVTHIFNKSLFDSLNQELDQKRPFGQWGEPFKWQTASKFKHYPTISQKNMFLMNAAQNIASYTQFYCGLIPDKQQFRLNQTHISESHVQKLRNERLFRMLTDYLSQLEEKLQFLQDDKTQVLVLISDWIWQELVSQMTLFFFF